MKRTKEEAEQTRLRLIDLALKEFLDKGMEESTLEGIAERAGVTRGAIYWHFKNKNDLFDALLEVKDLESIEIYKKIYKSDLSPIRKLNEMVKVGLPDISNARMLRNYTRLKVEMFNYFNKNGDKRGLGDVFLKYAKLTLKDGQKKGLIKNDIDVDIAAYTLFSLITGVFVRHKPTPSKFKTMNAFRNIIYNYIKLIQN